MLHRFHVTGDTGLENEYLVEGDGDTTAAANRLQSVLGTNDKVHASFPAPSPEDNGVYTLKDLPCPCSRPDSVGFWVWWRRGDQSPTLVETTGDADGLLIRECGNGKPRPMADWEHNRGHGQLYTRVYRPA